MSIYSYPESAIIDHIRFKKTANGAVRAYLHARPEVSSSRLHEITNALCAQGWQCIPATLDGNSVLEVRGFKWEGQLVSALAAKEMLQGKVQIADTKDDHHGFISNLKHRTLQASGAAFMLADLGFISYGKKEKSWEDTLAGLSYLSGSSTLMFYGRNDQSAKQIKTAATLILDHARARGFDIPADSAAAGICNKRDESPLRKAHRFLAEHPSEVGNMMYFAAGGLIAKSALQHRALITPRPGMTPQQIHEMRNGGWGDTLLGSLTMGSAALGTFVKEKKADPDRPKSHGLKAVADWIKEKPLRLAGYGYMGSTLCHAWTTFHEHAEARRVLKDHTLPASEHVLAANKLKSVPWRALFVFATLVGELLLTISSKGHGEGVVSDHSVDDSAVALAADLIVRQPKAMQESLIGYMSGFLGRPDVLAMKDAKVRDLLLAQVESLRKNPWSQSLNDADKNPAAGLEQKPASWNARINVPRAQDASQPHV